MSEHERRCRQTKIRLTIAELEHIRAQASAAGVTVAEYVRRRSLSLPVQPRTSLADARLLHELSAIGNNLNQIARHLNAGRERLDPANLGQVRNELAQVLQQVGAAFDD